MTFEATKSVSLCRLKPHDNVSTKYIRPTIIKVILFINKVVKIMLLAPCYTMIVVLPKGFASRIPRSIIVLNSYNLVLFLSLNPLFTSR